MEWLNNIISAWYTVNDEQVHTLVKDVLEAELNKLTPDLIEKITLEECTFGTDTPEIRGIKSRVVDLPSCGEGRKQKKLVLDIALGIDAPDFEFKLGVKIAMTFITLRAAVQKLLLVGNIRVTALFSDQVPFPGIQNLCITFTSRPQVGFNVELLDAIDIDAFGIDTIITNVLDDVLAKQLVYPGRLFVDLSQVGSGGGVKTVMMPRQSAQHPGVASMQIRVAKLHPDKSGLAKIDFSAELGKVEIKETIEFGAKETVASKNFLIADFDNEELIIKAYENRAAAKDIQLGSVKISLSDMEFSLPNMTQEFVNEAKNTKITIFVTANLLPLIAVQQKGKHVTDLRETFSGIICDNEPSVHHDTDKGVLYVHVHGAIDLPKEDSTSQSDPYVSVLYNGNEVLKTKPVSNSGNPIINEFTEFIITSHAGSQLVFKVYDDDTWPNSDDFLGTASLNLGKDTKRIVNRGLELKNADGTPTSDAKLFISVVFRPVNLL